MTPNITNNKVYWKPLLFLSAIKMCIHFYSAYFTEFGLQRDEYLYLDEANHLAWGFLEVPPMIPFIAWISTGLFGNTLLAVKIFPALVGAITILLLGLFVKELGGGKWAQIIAAIGFLASPAFLGSNALFQPVSFNQFLWFVGAIIVLKILNSQQEESPPYQYWLILAVVAALGVYTKYSVLFFYFGVFVALICTSYRSLLLSKWPYITLLITVALISPNIWWQYSHDFPIVGHMAELREIQLVNVTWQSFFMSQLTFHSATALIWLPGLVYAIRHNDERYRFMAICFIAIIVIIYMGDGKGYYTIGAYTMLFALGGIFWERLSPRYSWTVIPIVVLLNLPLTPIALPILPLEKMISYSTFVQDDLNMKEPFRWEDGVVRDLRQDYADMLGWDEIPPKVAKVYNSLSEDERKHCLVWGGHYGQAGVLNYEREKYGLPECRSFNSSYVAWVPEDFHIKAQIQVEDNKIGSSPFFEQTILMDSIQNPWARDPGYIYLKRYPTQDLREPWKEIVKEAKAEAGY